MTEDIAARTQSGAFIVRRWKTLSSGAGKSPVMTGNELARQFSVLHPEIGDMTALVRRMAADVGLHLRSRSISFDQVLSAVSNDGVDAPLRADAADEQAVLGAMMQVLADRDIRQDAVFGAALSDVGSLVGTERAGINV